MKKTFVTLLAAVVALTTAAQRFAVLSDIHVTPGNRNDSMLRVAVEEINAQPFDLVVVDGDLSNEGSDDQLANVKGILDGIAHPLVVLPGNHENNWSQSATKTFVDLWGNDRFVRRVGDLLVVGINCGPYMKMGDGHIKQEDLHWLHQTLTDSLAPGMRVLSFCHYPIRQDDLDNYVEYAQVLEQFPVIGHINGHYHHWQHYKVGDIDAGMVRALDMRNGNYGYSIVEVSPQWVHVYNKELGHEPTAKYAWAVKTQHKPLEVKRDMALTVPEGLDVRRVWADSASVFTRLAFDADNVYFGTSTGVAKAVDKAGGTASWQLPLGASLFSRPVNLGGGRIAVPHATGIAIVDAKSGRALKQYPSAQGPYVADGVVANGGRDYLQGGYKRFEKRDAKTGKVRWCYDSLFNYCQAAPAVDGNDVVFGAWDTNLRCLDLRTGRLRWVWNNGKSANMLGPGNVVPVIAGDKVIVVAPDRYMTAVDRQTGRTLWRDNSHRYRESLGHNADRTAVYAKTMDGELVCVDATTPDFKELWTLDLGLGYEHAPCIVLEHDGMIYVGSRRGIVTVVDADTHEFWQLPLGVSEVNGFDVDPTDGSVWTSLIEGAIYRIAKQ